MFAYKTNSPDYLDYVASSMTREQIKADPDLCVLLENEYIKDNMEIAIRWNDAKNGDYQDKMEFVEYLLCNGPELDADTILHYRSLAYADPACMEIAYSYYTDSTILSRLRETKYGKKSNDLWDCFSNPCFYLGRFSGVMGSLGDKKNTETFFNVLGEQLATFYSRKKIKEMEQHKAEIQGKLAYQNDKMDVVNSINKANNEANREIKPNEDMTSNPIPTSPPTSESFKGWVIPSVQKGWDMLCAAFTVSNEEFIVNEICNNEKVKDWGIQCKLGDWYSKKVQAGLELNTKANVRRQLGDCGRLWSQVRRLRVFSSENCYGPITSDQLMSGKDPDGSPILTINKLHPTPADATKPLANAKHVKDLNNTVSE